MNSSAPAEFSQSQLSYSRKGYFSSSLILSLLFWVHIEEKIPSLSSTYRYCPALWACCLDGRAPGRAVAPPSHPPEADVMEPQGGNKSHSDPAPALQQHCSVTLLLQAGLATLSAFPAVLEDEQSRQQFLLSSLLSRSELEHKLCYSSSFSEFPPLPLFRV